MSVSGKISELISSRDKNLFLQSPFLSPVQISSELDLSTDHPNFLPENSVLEGVFKALETRETHYVDVPGVASLRECIQTYLNETRIDHLEVDQIQVTAGMQESRFLTIQSIYELYGSLGLPDVVHPGVRKAAGVRSLRVVSLPVDNQRKLPTIEGIRTAAEEGCKVIFLESPSRLTGVVFSETEVKEIGQLVEEFSLNVVWDQGLSPWIKDENYTSLGSIPSIQENVIIIGELWPGTGLDRFYLGYIAGPKKYMTVFKTKKQILSICTNAQVQFAAIDAFHVYRKNHGAQLSQLSAYHEYAIESAHRLGLKLLDSAVVNLVAFYSNPDVFKCLHSQGYQFIDGKDFGAEGIIRLSVTPNGAVLKALESVKE